MENKKRLTIAVFIGDTYTAYANELLNGFYACAQKEQVNLVFLMRSSLPRDTNTVISDMTGDNFQVHFSSIYDYVPLIKPDAIILAYGSLTIFSDTPSKEALLSYYKDIPCLLLKEVSDDPDIPYLVADNYVGMCECIEHLITEHGYKKIAFLAGPAINHDSNERLRGYYDTMHKHGLSVTETMVTHGDYSESVDAQVNYLLDSNPGLEAIAFANDNMAKAGYRICKERGLIVGHDLAITGFDDVDFAKSMYPPLTSVMHNSFLFSYQAVKNAIQLCRGEATSFHTLPTFFHQRSSCGCSDALANVNSRQGSLDEIISFVHVNIDRIVDDFFFSFPYKEEKQQYRHLLVRFFNSIIKNIFEKESAEFGFNSLIPVLKKLCAHPRISPQTTLDHIVRLLKELIPYTSVDSTRDSLMNIIGSIQQFVLSNENDSLRSNDLQSLHQTWFSNSFTQDLQASDLSFEECMRHIMNRLKLMNIKSCYFFLRSEPVENESAYQLQLPEGLCLAAFYNDRATVPFALQDWIPVNSNIGISHFLPQDDIHVYSTHVLFSGKKQYGFLLCENEVEDIPFMATCCLQIGSFLRFYTLNANEKKVRKELEASLKLIKEQNSILNFISEYDELTNLLNRRGFMEKTIHALSDNLGKTAYILFADLDHLKEINDSFGHAAGDFALQTTAQYLYDSLPEDAIIARISGDEFVAFIVNDTENFDQLTKQSLKEHYDTYNQNSDKPYYIEMSVGIKKCVCTETTSIQDMLQQSDALLYSEKAHRRSSAIK